MSYYKRNLPHYQPKGYFYFITTRLTGSLPREVVDKIQTQMEEEIKVIPENFNKKYTTEKFNNIRRSYFHKYEEILDLAKYGNTWLNIEKIAKIVKDALHFYDEKRYNLICYTIMPNHVHLVLYPIVERNSVSLNSRNEGSNDEIKTINYRKSGSEDSLYIVTEIMQNIKKYTAREANKILNRTGQFWQHESYDHVIRNNEELYNTVNYILNNPMKAGLVRNPADWKWNYVNNKLLV